MRRFGLRHGGRFRSGENTDSFLRHEGTESEEQIRLMAEKRQLEFFLLRYVPDAVKDEFVNIGVVMVEPGANGAGFADVRFTRDWRRVRCLDPQVDVEMLEALEREIRGQLNGDRATLLRRLEDSFSNVIQLSPVKGCLAEDPAHEIDTIASIYLEAARVAAPRPATGRRLILESMRDAFERAGVLQLLSAVPVAPYTKPGDPFQFDFGYRVGGDIKLFHAVSLKAGVETAVTLAARYPKIAPVMEKMTSATPKLTAVIDDDLDRGREEIQFALSMMEEERIRIALAAEMPMIAKAARVELRV